MVFVGIYVGYHWPKVQVVVGCVRLEFVRFPELFFFLTVKDTIESISYYQAHLISDVSLVLEVVGHF